MGAADTSLVAIGLAALLSGCAHLPPLIAHRDPLSADEHLRLGSSYEAQGLKDRAAEQYEEAVRLEPANAEGWVAAGNLAFESGDLAVAERRFLRALKASPGHAGASNNLAMVYLARNEKIADAERLAKEALRQDGPLKPYVLDTLANVYLRQSRLEEARSAADLAEKTAPPGDADFMKRLLETKKKVAEAVQ